MDVLLVLYCCYASNYCGSHYQFTLNKTQSHNNSTFCALLSEDQLFNISSKVQTDYRLSHGKFYNTHSIVCDIKSILKISCYCSQSQHNDYGVQFQNASFNLSTF